MNAETRHATGIRSSTARVDQQGRVLIPVEQRRQLGIEPGDRVALQVVDGELRLTTLDEEIRRAQEIVRTHAPFDRLLSEELIAERRTEAARELADGG